MWTATTRAQHMRDGLRFASDLTDAEWAVLEPLLPPVSPIGRRPAWPLRELVNAMCYVLRGGIPWRMLPPCFPPRQTVYGWFAAWRDAGVWPSINHHLVMLDRERAGREASPSAVVIDRWGVAARRSRWRGRPGTTPRGIEESSMRTRRTDMAHYVGLDVSVRQTSICVVDEAGKIVREARVASEPEAIIPILTAQQINCCRVGLEAGPLSQWLFNGLAAAGLPAICVETRHMKAALAAQINKTDRNDARGIAQMMRVGLYRPVHVKTIVSQEKRTLLAARKLLQGQIRALENDLRGLLRTFGLKVGPTSAGAFDARILELVDPLPRLTAIVRPLLNAREVLRSQFAALHRLLLDLVRDDPVCRRFMTVPGVGPVVAITFQATVDIPQRFVNSKAVGAHFGLTPRAFSSGETDYTGRISRSGDALMRATLYEAAHTLLTHTQRWSGLKAWGTRVAQRRGLLKATVAVARKLAVILHRMWMDNTEFRWSAQPAAA